MADRILLIDGDSALFSDAIVLYRSGRIVARVHATYDFSDCPEELRASAVQYISPVQAFLPSLARLERSDQVMTIYRRQLDEYEGLSWYRRLFRNPPTVSAVSDTFEPLDDQ